MMISKPPNAIHCSGKIIPNVVIPYCSDIAVDDKRLAEIKYDGK
jgi:hypothetical protein